MFDPRHYIHRKCKLFKKWFYILTESPVLQLQKTQSTSASVPEWLLENALNSAQGNLQFWIKDGGRFVGSSIPCPDIGSLAGHRLPHCRRICGLWGPQGTLSPRIKTTSRGSDGRFTQFGFCPVSLDTPHEPECSCSGHLRQQRAAKIPKPLSGSDVGNKAWVRSSCPYCPAGTIGTRDPALPLGRGVIEQQEPSGLLGWIARVL